MKILNTNNCVNRIVLYLEGLFSVPKKMGNDKLT